MKRIHFRYLILGIVLGVAASLLITRFRNSKSQGIVAPYYEPKVFQKPPELKKLEANEATISAKIPIILYHYVEYVQDVNDVIRKRLDINPQVFEQELKTLNKNEYQMLQVREIPDILDGKTKVSTRSAVLTFDDGYEDFYTSVLPLLKKYNIKVTLYVVYDFIGRKGFLNANELREIINSGLVEIGAHTLDHVYLKSIPKSVAKKQIEQSKKLLEDEYGIKVNTFAYPYGAFSQDTIDLVREASFSAAVSVIPGSIQSKENLFYLSRFRAGMFSGNNIVKILDNLKK